MQVVPGSSTNRTKAFILSEAGYITHVSSDGGIAEIKLEKTEGKITQK